MVVQGTEDLISSLRVRSYRVIERPRRPRPGRRDEESVRTDQGSYVPDLRERDSVPVSFDVELP